MQELLPWDDITSSEEWKLLDDTNKRRVMNQYQEDLSKTSVWKPLTGLEKQKVLQNIRIDAGFFRPEELEGPSFPLRAAEFVTGTAETARGLVTGIPAFVTGIGTQAITAPFVGSKRAKELRQEAETFISPPPTTTTGREALGIAGKITEIPFYPARKTGEFVTEKISPEAGAAVGLMGEIGTAVALGRIIGGGREAVTRKPVWERPVTEADIRIEEAKQIPYFGETKLLPAPQLKLPPGQGFLMQEPKPTGKLRPFYTIPPEVKTKLRLHDPTKHTPVVEEPSMERVKPWEEPRRGPIEEGFKSPEMMRFEPAEGNPLNVRDIFPPELEAGEVPVGVGPPKVSNIPKTIKVPIDTPTKTFRKYVEEKGYKWSDVTRKNPDYPGLYADYWEEIRKGKPPTFEEAVKTAEQISEAKLGRAKALLESEAGFIEIPIEEIRRAARRVQEFWRPMSSLPQYKELLNLRADTMGKVALAEKNVDYAIERTKKLTPQQDRNIWQAINNDISFDALDPLSREIADEFRIANNEVGRQMKDRGMITEAQWEAHKDHYVHYRHLRYVLGDDAHIAVKSTGKLDLRETKARNPKLTKEQHEALGRIEEISKAEPLGLALSLTDIVKNDYFAQLASDPRNVWMPSVVEIHGIPKQYATSGMAQSQVTRLSKMLQQGHEVINNTDGTFSVRNINSGKLVGEKMSIGDLIKETKIYQKMNKAIPNNKAILNRLNAYEIALNDARAMTGNAPRDFVQIPISEKWGNLSGAYVRKEIARDLFSWYGKQQTNIPELTKFTKLLELDATLTGLFKMGKVPFNIPTAIRNVVSNPFQWGLSGTPPYEIPVYITRGIEHMLKKDVTYGEAFRKGLFKTNWAVEELREVMEPFRKFKGDTWGDIIGTLQKVAKYYGRIDDIYKMGKFTEVFEKTGDAKLAAIEAQKWIMDYSLADPSIKWARRHAIPFASYSYKIAPLIAESLVKRPWVIGSTFALPYAMVEVMKAINPDMTDEDVEEIKKGIPQQIKEKGTWMIVPFKIKNKWYWMDYSYFLPWGNWLNAVQAAKRKEVGRIAGEFGVAGTPFLSALRAFGPSMGIHPRIPEDPYSGKKMYSELDDPSVKAGKMLEWFYSQMAPSMLTEFGALGYFADIGTKDKFGRQVIPQQAIGRVFGVNLNEVNEQVQNLSIKYRTDELKRELARVMSDPKISPKKKRKYQENFKKEIQATQELRK